MAEPQPDHENPIQRFLTWENSSARVGTLGPKNEDTGRYIPHTSLESYFNSPDMVKKILEALSLTKSPNARYVWQHYRWGFATLLSIGKGRMICQFVEFEALQDKHLPFREGPPTDFPTSTDGDLFALFYRHQWRYFPLELNYRMRGPIPPSAILPFQVKKKLGRGRSANVHQVCVDEDYNKLGHPVGSTST